MTIRIGNRVITPRGRGEVVGGPYVGRFKVRLDAPLPTWIPPRRKKVTLSKRDLYDDYYVLTEDKLLLLPTSSHALDGAIQRAYTRAMLVCQQTRRTPQGRKGRVPLLQDAELLLRSLVLPEHEQFWYSFVCYFGADCHRCFSEFNQALVEVARQLAPTEPAVCALSRFIRDLPRYLPRTGELVYVDLPLVETRFERRLATVTNVAEFEVGPRKETLITLDGVARILGPSRPEHVSPVDAVVRLGALVRRKGGAAAAKPGDRRRRFMRNSRNLS